MTSPVFSLLREHLAIKVCEDGQVCVSVTIPPELLRPYCLLLESLAGFFQVANRQTTIAKAQAKAVAARLEPEAQTHLAAYRSRIVAAFDRHTAAGLDRKEAIKRVAAELRSQSHPWSSPDLVRSQLVAAGRGAAADEV